MPKACSKGERNVPDGEVYTAPVRASVNGTIAFNVPSIFQGVRSRGCASGFENGRVRGRSPARPEALNRILDTDSGARFVGEFAFGVNPRL